MRWLRDYGEIMRCGMLSHHGTDENVTKLKSSKACNAAPRAARHGFAEQQPAHPACM
jgi:hypothetical protein